MILEDNEALDKFEDKFGKGDNVGEDTRARIGHIGKLGKIKL